MNIWMILWIIIYTYEERSWILSLDFHTKGYEQQKK